MLTDIDGLIFMAVALSNDDLMKTALHSEVLAKGYAGLIYLDANFDSDRPETDSAQFYSKLRLESVSYESPPKIEVSLRVSLDCAKIVRSILEFVKFVITLREQKEILRTHSYLERQSALSKEIENGRRIVELRLDYLSEPDAKLVIDALVERVDSLTYGRDYPALKRLTLERKD
jgi:hypothetical protein